MNLRYLETFIEVCKQRSFSNAAKALYISQPTVSNHIQALENELNIILIDRNSKDITLTKAGEFLLDFSQKITLEKDKFDNLISQLTNTFTGVLGIASSSVPEIQILPDIISKFSKIYPSTKYKIRHYDSFNVIKKLEDKNCMFGFTGYKKTNSFVKFHKLAEDELVVIEGINSNFLNKTSNFINVSDIIDKPFIMREEGSGSKYHINNIKGLNICDLNILVEVDTIELIKKLVISGFGISLISKNCLTNEDFKNLRIYRLKNNSIYRNLYFCYNSTQYLTPFEEEFKQFILQNNP